MPSMSWSLTWSRWETSLLQKLSPGLQFYSAEDVPQTPPKAPNQTKRARSWYWWRHGAKASCKEEASSRPVGGSLVDSCADPASHHIEKEGVAVSARPSALSSLSFDWICKALSPVSMVQPMPPPKSTSAAHGRARVSFSQREVGEMEDEYVEDQASSDLARAVMEQSKALTALVSQIASSSGEDLGTASSSLSSKGSLGRARL